jgi:hypothetical protein
MHRFIGHQYIVPDQTCMGVFYGLTACLRHERHPVPVQVDADRPSRRRDAIAPPYFPVVAHTCPLMRAFLRQKILVRLLTSINSPTNIRPSERATAGNRQARRSLKTWWMIRGEAPAKAGAATTSCPVARTAEAKVRETRISLGEWPVGLR